MNMRTDFCTECREEREYILKRKNVTKQVKDKEYTFSITFAECSKCGEEMSIPGLIDLNIKEFDAEYRAFEGIVSVADIERLMKIYRIGKAPLSLALGFGEITITRYLSGQIPSKEYSDIIGKALASPGYMKEKLLENKEKIAPAAYKKAFEAATQMENLFSVSESMLRIIAYIFYRLEEVTPLMLQKLLYFVQGISFAVNHKPVFPEICQAWAHGPVYPEVYDMFRDFTYNPIEDARFAIFEGIEENLTADEKKAADLVINTFGKYGGKVLEKITHAEEPWKLARKGYDDYIPSNEIIPSVTIKEYYVRKNEEYDFSSEEGIERYIKGILEK